VTGSPVGGSPPAPATPPDFGPAPATPKTPTPPKPQETPAAIKPISGPPALPPANPNTGAGTPGAKLEFTKPENRNTVTPITNIERTPTTSYDVDLYEPKSGDTYEAISREFYNDTRYAPALRAYNRNKPLQGAGPLDVPPLHVIKRYGQGASPGGNVGTPVSRPGGTGEWGPAPANTPGTGSVRNGGDKTFRVPQGGMSMRAVARLTLGNEQRWNEVYQLNPHLRPDEILPAGTDLRLPSDARTP
jgi:nucleoid-associated protein YgaU